MKYLSFAFILLTFVGCSVTPKQEISIVPIPTKVVQKNGSLNWKTGQPLTVAYSEASLQKAAIQWNNMLSEVYGFNVTTNEGSTGDIVLSKADIANAEGYEMDVTTSGVTVKAASAAGAYYAMQTFKQLMPLKVEVAEKSKISVPEVSIADEPAFGYRGAHLDVARHFFNADSVKRYIDILAMHKINTFHWHLTEDQGWRIEIKKYPSLTEIGSYRPRTVLGRNSGEYDNVPVSGYYTQEEIKDIVKYADDRFITIIPEIDMPGHMLAALTAYPELGCRGKNYKVAETWGVFEEVLCAGNEKVYQFVYDVLDEVIQLFPSKYVHIGGDECPKEEWEKCPKCQAKIRELKLKGDGVHTAEQQLQSHFTKEVERYLNDHDRYLIGWDEIMEGGLSETATVMSWRGASHAYEAAKLGNDAILTPNTYLYFDYYQTDDIADEPLAIGGFISVKKVYEYKAVEDDVPADIRKHILGVQANMWTEYMKTFRHVEYMLLPRLAALSEVNWSDAPRDYDAFIKRLEHMMKQYDENGYNYARHIFDVNSQLERDNENHTLKMKLSALSNADIRYTTDGSEPTRNSDKYTSPVTIDRPMTFKAIAFYDDAKSRTTTQIFDFNIATAKPIVLNTEPNKAYAANGANTLNDGLVGTKLFNTGRWIGFVGNDLSATIDLVNPTEISMVGLNSLIITGDWIFRPVSISVFTSDDNENFTLAKEIRPESDTKHVNVIERYNVDFEPQTTRYVKVVVESLKQMPQWHAGPGKPSYIFVDEIGIY